MKKGKASNSSGITLIALVLTIIVLLILAGISIAMLSGDNNILSRATDAKRATERQSIVEQARIDILGCQAENKGRDLDKSQLKSVLDMYFKDVPSAENLPDGEKLLNLELNTLEKYGTYQIKVYEIYNGNSKKSQTKTISFNISYIYHDGAHTSNYTVNEGQTWYEWAKSTKNEPIPLYNLSNYEGSLQQLIIDLVENPDVSDIWNVERDNKTIIGFNDGRDHVEFFTENDRNAYFYPTSEIIGNETYKVDIWWED